LGPFSFFSPKIINAMASAGRGFEAAGLLGGLILSGALLPQVVKVARSHSTEDISYGWQLTYIAGLVPTLCYMFHFGLWPVAIPGSLELLMILALTFMKFWFERSGPEDRTKAEMEAVGEKHDAAVGMQASNGDGETTNGESSSASNAEALELGVDDR
jgi:MtN3 and saliva related transmembrane protein